MQARAGWALSAVWAAGLCWGCGDSGKTGCGASTRPSDGLVRVDGECIYRFPASYDGSTPMPLVFAFHAANNPSTQFVGATEGTPLETDFVMAFPKSVAAYWVYEVDAPRFDRMYRELVSNYCIDTHRVFAFGHSSGAQFIEVGLTRSRGRLLKGGYEIGYGIRDQGEADATAVHGGV